MPFLLLLILPKKWRNLMENPCQRLTGKCSVPEDTLQGAPKGQRQAEPPLLQKDREAHRAMSGYKLGLQGSLGCT